MIHLCVGARLPKHQNDRGEYFSAEHGLAAFVGHIDHLNATFIPAKYALGDPA